MTEKEMVIQDATLASRFWAKVDVRDATECWEWTATKSAGRYGAIKVGGKYGKDLKAHRVQAIWCGHEIDGKVVRHKCDNSICVNPAHLEVGDQIDNVRDMYERGRNNNASGCRHGNSRLTIEAVGEIRSLLSEGLSTMDIVRRTGLGYGVIYGIASRKSYASVFSEKKYPSPSCRGEKSCNAKLTAEVVGEMRRMYRSVKSFRVVSEHFGFNRAITRRAVTGERWDGVYGGEHPVAETDKELRRYASRKLSDADAYQIKILILSGKKSAREIGEQFGVSASLVQAIKKGRAYPHI